MTRVDHAQDTTDPVEHMRRQTVGTTVYVTNIDQMLPNGSIDYSKVGQVYISYEAAARYFTDQGYSEYPTVRGVFEKWNADGSEYQGYVFERVVQ